MKKLSIVLAIIVMLFLLLFATNPSKEQHQDAVQHALASYVNESCAKQDSSGFLSLIGSVLTTKISETILDGCFDVEDYYVCSVGYVTLGSKRKKISFGVFNHVYTIDSTDIDRSVQNLMK